MDGARYLEDGKLTIFRRSGTYYARIRISPGKYHCRSLKTSNEQTAIQAGRRLLFQIEQRDEQGLPPATQLGRKLTTFRRKIRLSRMEVIECVREKRHPAGDTGGVSGKVVGDVRRVFSLTISR